MPKREKQAEAKALIAELATAKTRQAAMFLDARMKGTEIGGGRATVEDARMAARVGLARAGQRDPEIIRWELTALLGTAPGGDD